MEKKHAIFSVSVWLLPTAFILILISLNIFFPTWHWVNEAIHSTFEAVGGTVAILLGLFLLQREAEEFLGIFSLVALGLLNMGFLDILCGMVDLGNSLIFFHSSISLVGGLWFCLVWLPEATTARFFGRNRGTFWLAQGLTGGLVALTLSSRQWLPTMLVGNNFTPLAIALNILAGFLFLTTIPRFFALFNHSEELDFLLFLSASLLFGFAEITFPFVVPWSSGWWLWHLTRLVVYSLIFLFLCHHYFQKVRLQKHGQAETAQQKVALEALVAEQTEALAVQGQALEDYQRSLQETIKEFSTFAAKVTQGNLTARLTLNNHSELGFLSRSLNQMVEALEALTSQMEEAATGTVTAAAEILAASSGQSSTAAVQAEAITQVTTTVEEVKIIAAQTAQQAEQLAQGNQITLQAAQRGTEAVESTIQGMGQIRQQVEVIAQNILALSERTQAIGAITTTVSELADQSNLLALNAAIEAARAGEQGRSFAVVSQHVRDLAERSKSATTQVQEILTQIQKATNSVVMVTEEGMKSVEQGVRLSGGAGEVIRQIAVEIEGGSQANTQIVAASHQQMAGMEQIGHAMRTIQQATTKSLAGTRQTEVAVRDLHTLARNLQQTIANYRLRSGDEKKR